RAEALATITSGNFFAEVYKTFEALFILKLREFFYDIHQLASENLAFNQSTISVSFQATMQPVSERL
ncbi:MAG: hypothetical protein O2817_13395, partial [Proteobacteria bacterium]|nr:hypothetical protein [Pseudomonadota bacterium]